MKKTIYVFLSLFIAVNIFGQESNKSLSQQLWDKVTPCFKVINKLSHGNWDWKKDFDSTVIDDSKSGYLHVFVTYPTCGCTHGHTVGAYTNKDGGYTFLERETWDCDFIFKMFSNRPLKNILPEGFGVKDFMPKLNSKGITQAFYYVDVDIPRKGTDTKLTIELIPFGANFKSRDILLYEYPGNTSENSKNLDYSIMNIAKGVKNVQTIQYLLNEEYAKISLTDMKIINDNIDRFESITELTVHLKIIKQAYDLSTLIEYKSCILDWDVEKSRFFLKEKVKAEKLPSFRDFLINAPYLILGC